VEKGRENSNEDETQGWPCLQARLFPCMHCHKTISYATANINRADPQRAFDYRCLKDKVSLLIEFSTSILKGFCYRNSFTM
jgi:hypothetical protein